MGQGRIKSIDMAKGIAIVVIVIVHLTAMSSDGMTPNFDTGSPLFDIPYSMLMLFFVFAGYFYRPKNSFKKNARKRFVQLMVTYFICSVGLTAALLGYLSVLGYDTSMDDPVLAFVKIFFGLGDTRVTPYNPLCGMYFIPLLFFALLILYAIYDKVADHRWKLVLAEFILVSLSAVLVEFVDFDLPYSFKSVPMAAAFMLMGAYLAKSKILEKMDEGVTTKRFWIVMVCTLAVSGTVSFFFPTTNTFNMSIFGEYGGWSAYTFFIVEGAGAIFMYGLVCIVSKIPYLPDLFSFVGRYTLEILMLHVFLIQVMVAPFIFIPRGACFPVMSPLTMVVLWVLSIILSILISTAVRRIMARMKARRSVDSA